MINLRSGRVKGGLVAWSGVDGLIVVDNGEEMGRAGEIVMGGHVHGRGGNEELRRRRGWRLCGGVGRGRGWGLRADWTQSSDLSLLELLRTTVYQSDRSSEQQPAAARYCSLLSKVESASLGANDMNRHVLHHHPPLTPLDTLVSTGDVLRAGLVCNGLTLIAMGAKDE